MPFFAKYRDWRTAYAAWERDGDIPMMGAPVANAFRVGIYRFRHGERERGAEIVRGAYWRAVVTARVDPHPFHKHVAETATRFGIDLGEEPSSSE